MPHAMEWSLATPKMSALLALEQTHQLHPSLRRRGRRRAPSVSPARKDAPSARNASSRASRPAWSGSSRPRGRAANGRGPSRVPVPGRRGGTGGPTGSASMQKRSRGHAKRRCSEAATLVPRPHSPGHHWPGGHVSRGPGARSDTLVLSDPRRRRERVPGAVVAHLHRLAAVPRHGLPLAARFRARVSPGRFAHVHRDAGGPGCRSGPAGHGAKRPRPRPAAGGGGARGHRARRPRPRHRDEPAVHDGPGRLCRAPHGRGGCSAGEGRPGGQRAASTHLPAGGQPGRAARRASRQGPHGEWQRGRRRCRHRRHRHGGRPRRR